jgi:hypothetical protein
LLVVLEVVAIGVAIGIGMAANGDAGIGTFVGLTFLAIVAFMLVRSSARGMCKPACVGPEPAVQHLGWSGSISTFAFQSPRYAVRFAEDNGKKLINVSMQLRQLLAQSTQAQVSLPLPTAPSPVPRQSFASPSPSPAISPSAAAPALRSAPAPQPSDRVLEWIAKIESLKGTEARRNALQRALAEIQEPMLRSELMLAASRIEVAAVLDKVDTLSTSAAKKRHLQKAIADLRSDTIPDELQADQIRQLELRLQEIT